MAKRKARKKAKSRRGRPVTTGKGELVGLRCHKPFLERVDRWRASGAISRPAAIIQLAELGLQHSNDAKAGPD